MKPTPLRILSSLFRSARLYMPTSTQLMSRENLGSRYPHKRSTIIIIKKKRHSPLARSHVTPLLCSLRVIPFVHCFALQPLPPDICAEACACHKLRCLADCRLRQEKQNRKSAKRKKQRKDCLFWCCAAAAEAKAEAAAGTTAALCVCAPVTSVPGKEVVVDFFFLFWSHHLCSGGLAGEKLAFIHDEASRRLTSRLHPLRKGEREKEGKQIHVTAPARKTGQP
jgi:hypothetical protein